jgi:hypothetical protein
LATNPWWHQPSRIFYPGCGGATAHVHTNCQPGQGSIKHCSESLSPTLTLKVRRLRVSPRLLHKQDVASSLGQAGRM